MLSCEEATRLLSEAQDRKLVLPEKLRLEIHMAMCSGCRHYLKQMNFLRTACRRLGEHQGQGDSGE
jgi:predicted anti-sigma-YlaC factor YlaD